MERISTGIHGLDGMTKGGLERGSITLVSGASGTGKTILALQFLHHGALKNEKGLYLTFDESALSLKETVINFGWDIDKFEDNVEIIEIALEEVKELVTTNFTTIADAVKSKKPKRVVIDPINAVTDMIENKSEQEVALEVLCKILRDDDFTTLLLSNVERNPEERSKYEIVEPFVDGVIALYLLVVSDGRYHSIEIIKMRRTDHYNRRVWFEVEKGINIDYRGYTDIW